MEISCQFSMSEPEPDLLQTILSFLDALELCFAASVCRCWKYVLPSAAAGY